MCRLNGVWIGVTEEESERLPCIADEQREVGEEFVMDDSELKMCCQEEMLRWSRLKRMLNLKGTEPIRHQQSA